VGPEGFEPSTNGLRVATYGFDRAARLDASHRVEQLRRIDFAHRQATEPRKHVLLEPDQGSYRVARTDLGQVTVVRHSRATASKLLLACCNLVAVSARRASLGSTPCSSNSRAWLTETRIRTTKPAAKPVRLYDAWRPLG
jgi:hypothetical protein